MEEIMFLLKLFQSIRKQETILKIIEIKINKNNSFLGGSHIY